MLVQRAAGHYRKKPKTILHPEYYPLFLDPVKYAVLTTKLEHEQNTWCGGTVFNMVLYFEMKRMDKAYEYTGNVCQACKDGHFLDCTDTKTCNCLCHI